MASSMDQTNIYWTSANANISFVINQMCVSTANTYAGIVTSTTTTPTKSNSMSLLYSFAAVFFALLALF